MGLGCNSFVDQQRQRVGPLEGKCLDRANQQTKEDGTQRSGEADNDRSDDHEEMPTTFKDLAGVGGGRGQGEAFDGSAQRSIPGRFTW
jgi:hypothetical protein